MSNSIKPIDRSMEIGEAILNDPILKELYRLKCKFILTYKVNGLFENGTVSLFISDKDQFIINKAMKHYRYETTLIHHEYLPSIVRINLIEFESVKETNFGFWIIETSLLEYYKLKRSYAKPTFVLKTSKKRYAYPTKKEALESFIIRSNKRVSYLKRDLNNAEMVLIKIKELNI